MEGFILDNPDGPIVLRSTGAHEHTDGNFLSWIPETKVVTFFEHRVEVEPLLALLEMIRDGATRGVMMLHAKGENDALASGAFESRPIPILPPTPVELEPED